MRRAIAIVLSDDERATLLNWARSRTVAARLMTRAKIVLAAAAGAESQEIAADLGLARDVEESFRIFQGRILDEYEAMAHEMGFHVIDATLSIEEQQGRMREIVESVLGKGLKNGVLHLPPGGDFGPQPSGPAVL